jgi:uncharacterized protein (TIGR01777 family)
MAISRQLRIVIPGGTGQLGNLLARHFHEQGHVVSTISRFPRARAWEAIHWDAETMGPWAAALEGADVVINLAGRSVNCRYTSSNRRVIMESRVRTTELLGKAIWQCEQPPKLWLNASTATIYRHALDRPMDEVSGEVGGHEADAPATWRFSIAVAEAWEEAFCSAPANMTRKVVMRMAPVMSPDSGGIFDTLLRLVRFGLGGTNGSGRQYVSWIHDVDLVRAIEFLIAREDIAGVVNVTSPNPIPNRQFMCCLRRAWCTSYIGLPSPQWMLAVGAFLLSTETELVLKSRRVIPGRLTDAGFDFHFPVWRGAAENLVERWRRMRID